MSSPVVVAKKALPIELQPGTYYWCACGRSAKQPFCDGSHQGSEFTPKAFTLDEAKKVFLCQCKHTKNPPTCDGTHKGLP
jgi:CDGSH iron-sulfur domain-containing protein 3